MTDKLKKLAMLKKILLGFPIALLMAGTASAQCDICTGDDPSDILTRLIEKTDSEYLRSPQKLQMMPGNPSYFTAEQGKELFHKKRGPKNASLESCDFGLGPGKLEGAFAKMPRYFEDVGRVMDMESRLVYCMKTIQGFSSDSDAVNNRGELRKLMAYIGSQSNGYEWRPSMDHPMEKAMRDAGEALFYRRAGKLDFSCATCHGEPGQRIRASALPSIEVPEEWTKAVSWPAYRIGKFSVRSPYQRIRGCYYQMRQGLIKPRTDAAIAIMSFWKDAARGQPAILPDMKR